MIKIFSILFEYASAFVGAAIYYEVYKNKIDRFEKSCYIFVGIILNPLVILDGAMWGQCDYIYTFFILSSILFLIKKRWSISFLLLGIAFTFKLQTILVVPVYILYYFISDEFSILYFLNIPIVYILGGLPAVLLGRSAKSVYSIYLRQTSSYQSMSLSCPNLCALLPDSYEWLAKYMIIITCAGLIAVFIMILHRKRNISEKELVLLFLWSNMTCIMMLPGMHERYIVVFHVLSIVLYLCHSRYFFIPFILSLIGVLSYCKYLLGSIIIEIPILAMFQLLMYGIISYNLICFIESEENNFN